MSRSSEKSHNRRVQFGALVALLTLATASATYLQGALSALSTYLVTEFEVTTTEYGLVFTVIFVTGGVGSLLVGRVVDAAAPRVMAALFAAAFVAILLVASAPSYTWVLAAGLVGGLGVAAANPVTNKLVSQAIPRERHGLVIGIKQSGPPSNLLAAGVMLPPLAIALGWRWALALSALPPLVGFAASWVLVPRAPDSVTVPRAGETAERSARKTVWWLAVIGFVRAVGGGSVIAFVPLYAHDALDFSPTLAGWTAALLGLSGVLGRLVWGTRVSRFREPAVLLTLLAALAVLSSAVIWAADAVTILIWFGVIGAGFSIIAWLAVSWLALLHAVDPADIGRTTGLIQFGTSAGFATGPPIMGLLVDASGGFALGWAFATATFVVTLVLTIVWRRSMAADAATPRPAT